VAEVCVVVPLAGGTACCCAIIDGDIEANMRTRHKMPDTIKIRRGNAELSFILVSLTLKNTNTANT